MFVQFISPGQFVAPFSLRLYVQDVGRADAFDKCALPKTNGYDNSTIQCEVWTMRGTPFRKTTIFRAALTAPSTTTTAHFRPRGLFTTLPRDEITGHARTRRRIKKFVRAQVRTVVCRWRATRGAAHADFRRNVLVRSVREVGRVLPLRAGLLTRQTGKVCRGSSRPGRVPLARCHLSTGL